jgi:hypothetical protein
MIAGPLKEIELRALLVGGYILPDELPQYLRGGYVLRLAGFKKSFVQIRFDANTKACCFPHCVAIGYTFFEAAVYALDIPGSSAFSGERLLCRRPERDVCGWFWPLSGRSVADIRAKKKEPPESGGPRVIQEKGVR